LHYFYNSDHHISVFVIIYISVPESTQGTS